METMKVQANGCEFYVEKRGSGPALVLVPDGVNDCGHFALIGDILSDEFTVYTFDMRGGSRSMPTEHKKLTAADLGDDVAAIIKALDIAPASVFGCSSGGQAVLSLGKDYPELCKNIIAHEAALLSDTPIEGTGLNFFMNVASYQPYCDGFLSRDVSFVGNYDQWHALGDDFLKRADENYKYWGQYYVGVNDVTTYSKEDLAIMPNLEFTVGCWTPAFQVYANIATAERAGVPYTWVNSAHYPYVTCPDEYAELLRTICKKYLDQHVATSQDCENLKTMSLLALVTQFFLITEEPGFYFLHYW